jgi:quinoprotein glucose dehydrogenase
VRCHKIEGKGGEVGPDLTKIAADKQRDYLLASIVTPSKTIAKNFETVVVVDTEGKVHSGILKAETAERLDLLTADGKLVSLPQAEIEQRKFGKSSMPEDLTKHLSKRELRDLIEFLAGRREGNARTAPESGE